MDSTTTAGQEAASGLSGVRHLYVKPKGSSAANQLAHVPTAPVLVLPASRTVVRVGQPVVLSWAASGTTSQVDVLLPSGQWQDLPWQPSTSYTFTPTAPGTYLWIAYTSNGSNCGAVVCVSGSSEQRYLVVAAGSRTSDAVPAG
ncbi:hypothetical protein ACWCXH_23410 [Kitasatospora sp. NPDC001660]